MVGPIPLCARGTDLVKIVGDAKTGGCETRCANCTCGPIQNDLSVVNPVGLAKTVLIINRRNVGGRFSLLRQGNSSLFSFKSSQSLVTNLLRTPRQIVEHIHHSTPDNIQKNFDNEVIQSPRNILYLLHDHCGCYPNDYVRLLQHG